MKPIYLFGFFQLLLIFSCKSTDVGTFDPSTKSLVFGAGGGFTGAINAYHITEEGNIYTKGIRDTIYTQVGKLNANIAKQQFVNFYQLGLDKMSLNKPGNRYYFVEMIDDKGKSHKVLWDSGLMKDTGLSLYHENMMRLINKVQKSSN